MAQYIDLHTHTTNSDGALAPQELINKAREAGIGILAITDHNKLLPQQEFEKLQGQNPDIRLIRGCEFTTSHRFSAGKKAEIHIVGIFLEETEQLKEFLQSNRTDGIEKAKLILEKLREACGIDLGSLEELQRQCPDKRVGRIQIARAMVDQGFAPGIKEAFDIYIGDYGQRLAWVESPSQFAAISEAVSAIHEAKGISVLAHPLSYKLNEEELQELFSVFQEAGGMAMEVEYSRYDREERVKLAAIAEDLGFLPSCASDFHGNEEGNEEGNRIDYHFPKQYFEALEARKRKEYSVNL